jgi:hypothetical protein
MALSGGTQRTQVVAVDRNGCVVVVVANVKENDRNTKSAKKGANERFE